jgi:hypothetical protein
VAKYKSVIYCNKTDHKTAKTTEEKLFCNKRHENGNGERERNCRHDLKTRREKK